MKELSECIVLIVEDTEINVDILVDSLGDDYDVRVALDGESALEAVNDELPDLILLDIMMPGMDGFEVYRNLQANPASQKIPVIFLSASTDSADKERTKALGAAGFIAKPIIVREVKEKVRNCLEQVA